MLNHMVATPMLCGPWPLLGVGVVIGIGADHHPRFMRRATTGAAWFALICAVLAAVAYGLNGAQSVSYLGVALPMHLRALAISIDANVLTVIMFLLVAFVGMIVARYSKTYMDGDEHEGRFHRWLALTLGSFLTLIVTGNMWGFWVSWVATSLCLHELLAFYRGRPGAVLAARKKYILHRIADVSLLMAFVLIVRVLHTAQWAGLASALTHMSGSLPGTLQVAVGLIVLSAILKSAQFPSHGWLIQVMEAPTPVSALLHAGIIYTGTFLILRASPLIAHIGWAGGWAGDVLVVVGLVSIVIASLTMMTVTNIKGSLAYSTCAQMGFMVMECGLGLYSIAVLHILAHSVYKAHAFLASGSVVEHFRAPALVASIGTSLWQVVLGLGIAVMMAVGIGAGFGVMLLQQPALIAMAAILTVGMTQLLLQALNARAIGTGTLLLRVGALSSLVCTAYFGLHVGFVYLLGTSVPIDPVHTDLIQKGLLGFIGLAFLALLLIQQFLPRLSQMPFWQAAYVHFYNGLYADGMLTEFVRGLGPIPGSVTGRRRVLNADPSREG